ncbi:phosphotransferase enzyme family protein [Streptacidiphilus sp. MAP5-3]|uniref:phosphotransferase enzyme family protein n=1 Tax=unclassified Streptacidiphilus TaxID=2643834 RepID=UPI003517A881
MTTTETSAIETSRTHLHQACHQAGLDTVYSREAEVIRLGENALWRLPGGIVARITRQGQQRAAAREVDVARWLAANDVPAVRPFAGLEQPVEAGGRAVTFWEELPPHRPGTPADLARLLRRLHALPVPHGIDLGRLDPFVRLPDRIREADLDDEARAWLLDRLDQLQAAWKALPPGLPECVVHGDAWGGNVAVLDDGMALLLDFERTSVGPPEWDLTSTAISRGTFSQLGAGDYRAFCDAYGGTDVLDWPGYPMMRDIRELRLVCFALQTALQHPHAREQARFRLDCLRGQRGPRPWNWTAVP